MRLCALMVMAVCLGAAADPPTKEAANMKLPQVKEKKLREELLRRMKSDQEARKPVLALMQKQEVDPDDIKKMDLPAVKHMAEIDHENTDRMKEIVRQFGWPGKSLVGADGANAAWLLVQHADHDRPFQKQCLEHLKAAVKEREATGEQLAYLTDRVRVGEKKKQVYGTQVRLVKGKLQPYPIEDEANVDRRRQEVGLMPLDAYLRFSQWALDQARKGKSGAK